VTDVNDVTVRIVKILSRVFALIGEIKSNTPKMLSLALLSKRGGLVSLYTGLVSLYTAVSLSLAFIGGVTVSASEYSLDSFDTVDHGNNRNSNSNYNSNRRPGTYPRTPASSRDHCTAIAIGSDATQSGIGAFVGQTADAEGNEDYRVTLAPKWLLH
jgi:hypothetical protein